MIYIARRKGTTDKTGRERQTLSGGSVLEVLGAHNVWKVPGSLPSRLPKEAFGVIAAEQLSGYERTEGGLLIAHKRLDERQKRLESSWQVGCQKSLELQAAE